MAETGHKQHDNLADERKARPGHDQQTKAANVEGVFREWKHLCQLNLQSLAQHVRLDHF